VSYVEPVLLLIPLPLLLAAACGACYAHSPQASSGSCIGTKISWWQPQSCGSVVSAAPLVGCCLIPLCHVIIACNRL